MTTNTVILQHVQASMELTLYFSSILQTYCVDKQVPDSACTATAYMSGVKTNFRAIGVSAKVKSGDCEGAKVEGNRVESIVQWAQKAGKATGIVTTTRVTHASPAGSYAHVNHRDMESDEDVKILGLDPKICDFDIAHQLVHEDTGKNIKVSILIFAKIKKNGPSR